jgi:two-component system response regulator HydG
VTAYAVLELVSRADRLDALSWALLTFAVLAALVPWSLSRPLDATEAAAGGVPRVAALGAAASLHAVAVAAPAQSLFLELCAACFPGVLGALVLSLAFVAPEPPRALSRAAFLATAWWALAVVASSLGAAVCLAPFELGGETVVLPGALLDVGPGVLLSALAMVVVLRAVRGRLGSGPYELAQSSLALLGSLAALLVLLALGAISRLWLRDAGSDLLRSGWLLALIAVVGGHVALVRGVQPARAASVVRHALASLLTYGAALALLWLCVESLQHAGWLAWGFVLAVGLGSMAIVHRVLLTASRYWLAPDRGRLLDAIESIRAAIEGVQSLEELGQRVLPPLRIASRSEDARPVILVVVPSAEVTVDLASVPHVRSSEGSPALFSRLRERPGEVLLRAPMEALVVRRPELRPLIEVLERHDALAVVALVSLGELEGALLVPRGKRRAAVTLEEMVALDGLGATLSGVVAALSAERRAQDRAGAAVLAVRALEQRIESLDDEIAVLRSEGAALKAGSAADRFSHPVVAYGERMRTFVERAEAVASLDAPVLLRAEAGTALEPVGQLLHAGSARREGPLVVADALTIQPERAMAALFGDAETRGSLPQGEGRDSLSRTQGHPGWLRLSQGGTLLLIDLPALPLPVQAALEEAIGSRQLPGNEPLDVRLVMTSRVDLAPLVQSGAVDGELAKRVESLTLEVPSLSQRREDLRSLVLLAIDRGCRALGKPMVGIEEDAMRALLAFPWTVGTRELDDVVERAVGRASGARITETDLALRETSIEPGAGSDDWVGSYSQLETRILEKALERASGNKSEAARALGLKRTTFLDKLRRAGLERGTQPPPAPDADA